MKKQMMYLMLTALLIGTFVPSVFAVPDGPLTDERFNQTGNYGIVAAGVGLEDSNNEITINVPGTVVAAYLYWAGYDVDTVDDTAYFDADELTANVYGPYPWKVGEYGEDDYKDHYVCYVDISSLSLITSGINTFSITGIVMDRVYGAGVIVVYENSSLPMAQVTILDGLDSFYVYFDGDRGPNSEVTSVMFDSASSPRTAELTMIVGGTEHDKRPNEVWTATGDNNDNLPVSIVGDGDSSGIDSGYPLYAADGGSWDTYNTDVTVNAGDTWLGVQVESFSAESYDPNLATSDEGLGNSGVIAAVAVVLPLPEPQFDGKVTGGGQIPIGTGKKETATFGFNAIGGSKQPGLKGELQYLDHTTGMLVHAHTIDSLIVWGENKENKPWPLRYAKFSGSCTVNHEEGFRFEVTVEDDGEPGKDDGFIIKIYKGSNSDPFYEKGGPIIKGNIQIHKP